MVNQPDETRLSGSPIDEILRESARRRQSEYAQAYQRWRETLRPPLDPDGIEPEK